MAKKESGLTYLQMPLPEGTKYSKLTKQSWSGLNLRQTIDTGELSMEKNISTKEAPYLTPSPKWLPYKDLNYKNPISMFGFDNFLLVIYRDGSLLKVDYIHKSGDVYTGVLKEDATSDDEYPRSVVQFNVYMESDDIVNGEYKKKLLIFPDKKSMYFDVDNLLNDEENDTGCDFKLQDMDVTIKEYYNETAPYLPPDTANRDDYYKNTYKCDETMQGTAIYKYSKYETEDENGNKDGGIEYGWKISIPPVFPDIKYAAVHLSRLFGVSDDSVYASGFNDYANWSLDSVDAYNESNAWCSKAQSNTKAGGEFTGITVFQGHVICFKRDFMHELYNTKNPFRIQDIFAEGSIDNRTIQDVDGRLIFVSDDNVKIYTGSNPRVIGYNLNINHFKSAVSGNDGRNYYLFCIDENDKKRLFVYDTYFEKWSEQSAVCSVLNFAHNKNGMYALCDDGFVYEISTENYKHRWCFETDLFTNTTVDIKHIKKIQLVADIAAGANLRIYILYDDEAYGPTSQLVYSGGSQGRNVIRIKPRQTASYGIKLHFEGFGYIRLYELEMHIQTGGDLYA